MTGEKLTNAVRSLAMQCASDRSSNDSRYVGVMLFAITGCLVAGSEASLCEHVMVWVRRQMTAQLLEIISAPEWPEDGEELL